MTNILTKKDVECLNKIIMIKVFTPEQKLQTLDKWCHTRENYFTAKLMYVEMIADAEFAKNELCSRRNYDSEVINKVTDYLAEHGWLDIYKYVGTDIMDIYKKAKRKRKSS